MQGCSNTNFISTPALSGEWEVGLKVRDSNCGLVFLVTSPHSEAQSCFDRIKDAQCSYHVGFIKVTYLLVIGAFEIDYSVKDEVEM